MKTTTIRHHSNMRRNHKRRASCYADVRRNYKDARYYIDATKNFLAMFGMTAFGVAFFMFLVVCC